MFAATTKPDAFRRDAAECMRAFTELVAIAISAVAAREELARSNERLAESRARVVAAADKERARVVRDLHDGAQQRLVHAIITLKLARRALATDDGEQASELTAEALEQAERANVELRELAQGISPSVLTHGGLLAGVRSLVDKMSLPVHVDVLAGRLPPQIEANAYFIIAEALTNVLKHAEAHAAEVRAFRTGDTLTVEVHDDGVGGAALSGSTGLVGLQDRAVAADGSLQHRQPSRRRHTRRRHAAAERELVRDTSGADKRQRTPLAGNVRCMALSAGTRRFGPDNASLQVKTYREGVAAKAGHDLIIEVTRWDATLEVADELAGWTIELNADPRSLEVREGLRGVKPLTDKDRVEIRKTIETKVLGSQPIRFRATDVRLLDEDRRLTIEGELSMAGGARPLTAQLTVDDGGAVSGTIPLTQSAWGIKPYRGLMGALKVRDEVEVVIAADLPSA